MKQYTVTKTTAKYVSVVLHKPSGDVKLTIRGWCQICCIDTDNKSAAAILESCKHLLAPDQYLKLKQTFAPTKADLKSRKERKTAFRNWVNDPAVDAELRPMWLKMVNDPGFMGIGIDQRDIDQTISKEVQLVYALK